MIVRRIVSLILDYVSEKILHPPHDQANGWNVVMTLGAVFLAMMIGLLGTITVLVDLILHSFNTPGLHLSQISWVGAFLIFVGVGLAQMQLMKRQRNRESSRSETGLDTQPLQLAVAELIRDYIEERKQRRQGLEGAEV